MNFDKFQIVKESYNNFKFLKNKNMHDRAEKMMHFIASFLAIFHAIDHYELGQGYFLFYFIIGLVTLNLMLFQKNLFKFYQKTAAVIYLMEGVLILLIAFEKLNSLDDLFPYIYMMISLFYFIFGYFIFTKKVNSKKRQL